MRNMFYNCSSLTNLDLSSFDTFNVIDMSFLFDNCRLIEDINLENLNTSNTVFMRGMFNGCQSLAHINVGNFNTQQVQDMASMFYGCSSLKSLNLTNFITSNVIDMGNMFALCSTLNNLDLSNFDTSKVVDMGCMFSDCQSLKTINLSNWDTSNVKRMSHDQGYDGQVKKYWGMFTNCSSLQTIIVSSNWNLENLIESDNMFLGCTNLVGGHGTKYDEKHVNHDYARIDSGETLPGYLTDNSATRVLHHIYKKGRESLYHNLHGYRTNQNYHGIMIENGKKYVK